MPLMKITRAFPFRGVTYEVGASADFPPVTCERMESARPPFGVRVEDEELETLTAPEPTVLRPLEEHTKDELLAIAAERGVEVYKSWTVDRIIARLYGEAE